MAVVYPGETPAQAIFDPLGVFHVRPGVTYPYPPPPATVMYAAAPASAPYVVATSRPAYYAYPTETPAQAFFDPLGVFHQRPAATVVYGGGRLQPALQKSDGPTPRSARTYPGYAYRNRYRNPASLRNDLDGPVAFVRHGGRMWASPINHRCPHQRAAAPLASRKRR